MKIYTAKCGDEKIKTIYPQGENRVLCKRVKPNDYNPNKVSAQMLEKLTFVIKETLDDAGRIPPIVCRPDPKNRKTLVIIDGEHRWRVLQELGHTEIDVTVLYVSKERAMFLTAELNYNRGEPDLEKYPEYLKRMMTEFEDVTTKYLSERLADSEDEIKAYLDAADFEVEEVKIDVDDDEDEDGDSKTKDASDADAIVEMKFQVRQGAAEVIEKELARLQKALNGGKNPRARALEAMAVLSSQTPSGSLELDDADDDAVSQPKPKKKKKKSKQERIAIEQV